VTHDNRILDVADRILTLEDGKVSSFAAGIAANTEQLLTAFAAMQRKGQLARHLEGLPDDQFVKALEDVTGEFEGLLRTLDLANAEATRALLDQVLETTAIRIRKLLGAQRATVYLVERERGVVRSKLAHHSGSAPFEIQMPLGTGIAGKVAATGEIMNIADPYSHPDFNPEIDRASATRAELGMTVRMFVTRSILCVPIFDRKGAVIGVAQLLNKKDEPTFSAEDERVLQAFAGSLGIILETCARLDLTVH
jgi:putative ABC transport system ATP-binding protein